MMGKCFTMKSYEFELQIVEDTRNEGAYFIRETFSTHRKTLHRAANLEKARNKEASLHNKLVERIELLDEREDERLSLLIDESDSGSGLTWGDLIW